MLFKVSDFESPDISRLCDVVMKGGVTSGVVYPNAICELATAYAIKNIGGTSVGAIAAAVTAAAEYRRRQTGSGEGYLELAKLPGFLGRERVLFSLFRADPTAAPLLRLALILIGTAAVPLRIASFVGALLLRYVWIPLLSIALFFGVFAWISGPLSGSALRNALLASVVLGLITALTGVGIRFVWHVMSVLDRNAFGWCHAYAANAVSKMEDAPDVTALDANSVPPLFNWLDRFVAQAAGRSKNDPPLCFGDLWHAKEPAWHDAAAGEHAIDFRMVTTCLTLGRPFQLPFDPDQFLSAQTDPQTDDAEIQRPPLYFRREDLARYFTPKVVDHMIANGVKKRVAGDKACYYRFPAAEQVPIIVGTRLSMSFPVLFCALPLYMLDGTGAMQKVWFSDGGLSSNFPIHFFDSPLPRWPTFAIDLLSADPSGGKRRTDQHSHAAAAYLAKFDAGNVIMEDEVSSSSVTPWNRLDSGGTPGKVLAFVSAIADAARNWQDVTLGTLPGNASRIVGIRLSAKQGGLNLNMQPDEIEAMSKLGACAGKKLLSVFAQGEAEAEGWRNHRWLRYRATMGAITRWVQGYQCGYPPFTEVPAQIPYQAMIDGLPPPQEPLARKVTNELVHLPIDTDFYQLEEKPIAVLPTRPVV